MTVRGYRFNECRWTLFQSQEASGPGTKIPGVQRRPELERQCHDPHNPEPGDQVIRWADVIAGEFWYNWGQKVEIRRAPECLEWGVFPPAERGCFADRTVAFGTEKINVLGRWRHRSGGYGDGIQGGQDPVKN